MGTEHPVNLSIPWKMTNMGYQKCITASDTLFVLFQTEFIIKWGTEKHLCNRIPTEAIIGVAIVTNGVTGTRYE